MNTGAKASSRNARLTHFQEVVDLNNTTLPTFEAPAAELIVRVRSLLSDELGLPPDIEESEGLFSNRHLQSIDVVTIIMLLRERFDITVRPDEVNLSNFDSISLIADFIERNEKTNKAEDI